MDFRVDSRAIDMFQQCRPSALLGYFQEAATLASLDLKVSGPEVMKKYHGMWMIARMWAQLDAPLYWNERFTIHTWHRGGRGASSYRDFDVIRDGVVMGQGVSTWVLVDADSHKLLLLKSLEEFQGTDGGELCKDKKLYRVKMPERFDERELRPMRYSETDINGHVNNIHYADFACDALHMERHGQGKFVRQFQIGYVGECHAGETIVIDTAVRGDELFARGGGQDGKERFDFAMTLENLK
jgi:acyl-ACP thioesterase